MTNSNRPPNEKLQPGPRTEAEADAMEGRNVIFRDAPDNEFAAKVQRDATNLCGEIGDFFVREKIVMNEIIFVPMIIYARIIRLRDAALTLTRARFPAEAGILVLSQFEAKLDLAQAARDVKWAARWVEHRNTHRSVTNIKSAIGATFDDKMNGRSSF
jgi:hypothetical protein